MRYKSSKPGPMLQVAPHAADLGYEALVPGDDADHERP